MEGWQNVRLVDVCEKITQGPNPKYDDKGDENYRVLKTKDLYDHAIHYDAADKVSKAVFDSCSSSELVKGDLLLAIVGQGSINKCNVFEGVNGRRFIFTRALGLLRPKASILNPYYLKYFLQSDAGKQLVDSGIAGTSGQQVVTTTHLKALEIPLPPLPEQKRIVAVLDEAFEGIDKAIANTEKNLANARELFASALRVEFARADDTWRELLLGENVRFIDYRGKTPPKTPEGIRLITAKNVKMGYINRDPEEFMERGAYADWMTRGFPKKGDVLFTTEAPLGNIAQLDTDEQVVIGQRLITMQPDPNVLTSEFLKFRLMSPQTQELIWSHATGATVQGIKAQLLKLIPIPTPSLEVQNRIARKLDILIEWTDQAEEQQLAKLAALTQLKASLLAQAFSGKLGSSELLTEAAE